MKKTMVVLTCSVMSRLIYDFFTQRHIMTSLLHQETHCIETLFSVDLSILSFLPSDPIIFVLNSFVFL